MPRKIKQISNSQKGAYQTCPKRFYFGTVRRLERRGPPPIYFTIGTAFHRGLEVWYKGKGKNPARAIREAKKVFKEVRDGHAHMASDLELNYEHEIICTAMLRGYFQTYKKDLKRWKLIAFEVEFELARDGYAYLGTIDMVVRDVRSGELLVVEHKTVGKLDQAYFVRVDLDDQITGYCIAAEEKYGEPVKRVVYNVIRKPSIRQRKNETRDEYLKRLTADYLERPDFYYVRAEIRRGGKRQRAILWRDLDRLVKRINEDLEEKHFPRNTKACVEQGYCTFLDLCLYGKQALAEFRTKTNDAYDDRRRIF